MSKPVFTLNAHKEQELFRVKEVIKKEIKSEKENLDIVPAPNGYSRNFSLGRISALEQVKTELERVIG